MEVKVKEYVDWHNNIVKIWYKKGNSAYYHREDGPAKIWKNGEEWWYYDVQYCDSKDMPLNLYLAYCKWEYKKNGS